MDPVYYSFRASGAAVSGVKFRCYGHVRLPADKDSVEEALEQARDAVLKQFPGATLKGERPGVTAYPSVLRLKKPPRKFK